MFNWKERLRAAAIHLAISLAIAGLAAALVFGLWYPGAYRELSGGRELFLLVVAVDVVMGPLITFAIFNRKKPRTELRRDLAIVGLLQLAALCYGLWTVYVARPVHLVFEYNRFRVVHAIEVPEELLSKAPAGITALPLTGPTNLSLRQFATEKEQFDATMGALGGVSLSARPDLWQPYEAARAQVLQEAKPLPALRQRFAARAAEIDAAVAATGRPASTLVYVPLAGRKTFWTVLLDASTAQPLGFLPLDSF
jgi:hypothetical protein